jgi:putative ABC transport system permease protein
MVAAHPEVYKPEDHFQIDVTRMHEQINSRANTILWILFAASGLLFVIASSNVANLVLARTVRREPELAIRAALGASTAVLRRSLLAESFVLCGSGALAAVALAIPMVAVLGRYASRFSARANDLTLDFSLVWFGIGLAAIAAVFLAFIPRLPSANAPQGGLTGRGARVAGGSSRRLRIFAVTQIAASFLLLAGACVLMKTLFVLEQTRPPFESANVLALNLPLMSYGRTPQQVDEFYREVQRKISAMPGVEHVSSGFSAPWRDDQRLNIAFQFAAQGARRADGQDFRAKFRSVSPGFFATFGMPLQEGRDFNDADKEGSERVVIITQSLAQMLYPGQDAVNHTLWWTDGVMQFIGISTEPRRIIAVVPDLDDENIIPSPAMTIYEPIEQEQGWNGRLFVRAHQDAYSLVPAITQTIHQMSADQPVEKASTLGDVRAEVLTPDRLNAIVFGGFAAVALLISVVGVAGVLAFSVSGRTREFGIRMSMGAMPRNILTIVLTEGLAMASLGVGAGVIVGFVLARAIAKYVTDIHQPGPLAFVGSAVVILGAAVIASAVPAARAARVNAVEALRSE